MGLKRRAMSKRRGNAKKRQEEKMKEIKEAKYDLETAFITFNEVTDSSYIDIAILKLNLAKRRFEVLIEEAKKENIYLQEAN